MITLALLCTGFWMSTGTIDTVVGTGDPGYSGDGQPATAAKLNNPFDVAVDSAGNLFFSDTNNHCVRRVDAQTGLITNVAGTGQIGERGDGGPAKQARLHEPYGVALDQDRYLYIVDRLNARIRRVDLTTGVITNVAGTGTKGYSGDGGPASQAQLREPNGIALDSKGKLYIADVSDQRIRVVDLKTGLINTLCGNGKRADTGDQGPYREASLNGPRAVAVAPDGSLYICMRGGHGVRRIDFNTGKITRFAGTGKRGYSGDGGPALEATFNGPKELAIDDTGNVLVVDTENQVIRRIDARTGIVTTVAGSGRQGGAGDGSVATEAELGRPHGVAVTPDGTLYIGDTLNHRIRRVRPAN